MALTDKLVAIANAIRAKTGKTGSLSLDQMATEISGIKTGVTPTGTKTITANGTYDVTSYASANVNVPSSGITPTGTKTITTNGTHDVTSYASAQVNVPTGLNAKVFTTTVASDVTSGNYTIFPANEYIASIRSNPNAFVVVRRLNHPTSTAMYSIWVAANFVLLYSGTTARKNILLRTTTSGNSVTFNANGLATNNYTGHLNVNTNGSLMIRDCNTTYPVRAGEYEIIAGVREML